jgi:uridine kinase
VSDHRSATLDVVTTAIVATSTPRLIAVDGRAGAGKTTFTARLLDVLSNPALVRVDDFLCWGELHCWWPRLQAEAIEPLLAGRTARFRIRDWVNDPLGDALGEWSTIHPAETILLDGVTSSRRAVAAHIAVSIWIDAPAGVRLRRGIERDGEAMRDHWNAWMQLEDDFFAMDDARSRANFVIDGSSESS